MRRKTAYLRFYEELNNFLPDEKRKVTFKHHFSGNPGVKDVIESVGVPHTEVDLILVNNRSVDFNYQIQNGDRVAVYPVFESLDISSVSRIRRQPLREPKFILDVHLGKLAKQLRMIGFDTLYQNHLDDDEIIEIGLKEKRIILTRDKGLLKNKKVTHGYWIRSSRPEEQLKEVVHRFDLQSRIRPFQRCMECNGLIKSIDKKEIKERLLPQTRKTFNEFFMCASCQKIYWKGSHYQKMKSVIAELYQEKG